MTDLTTREMWRAEARTEELEGDPFADADRLRILALCDALDRVAAFTIQSAPTHDVRHTEGYWRAQHDLRALLGLPSSPPPAEPLCSGSCLTGADIEVGGSGR